MTQSQLCSAANRRTTKGQTSLLTDFNQWRKVRCTPPLMLQRRAARLIWQMSLGTHESHHHTVDQVTCIPQNCRTKYFQSLIFKCKPLCIQYDMRFISMKNDAFQYFPCADNMFLVQFYTTIKLKIWHTGLNNKRERATTLIPCTGKITKETTSVHSGVFIGIAKGFLTRTMKSENRSSFETVNFLKPLFTLIPVIYGCIVVTLLIQTAFITGRGPTKKCHCLATLSFTFPHSPSQPPSGPPVSWTRLWQEPNENVNTLCSCRFLGEPHSSKSPTCHIRSSYLCKIDLKVVVNILTISK